MNLSEISIKNSVFAWMLMAGLILFGWISFRQMGISQMPDVDFPIVTVHVTYEGAAPEVMETDVVDIIEDAVMSVQGIRSVSSTARQGEGNITIEFELEREIDAALQEVQTKISQAQRRLPEDMDPPTVTKTNPEDQPILWVALFGERSQRELMAYARDHLKDRFQTVEGVGEVMFGGYIDPNLRIWLDPKKMEEREISVQDVIDALSRQHVEVPAGRVETSEKEINLRLLGEAKTLKDVEKMLIDKRGGAPIYHPVMLGELGRVELGLDEVRRISRTSGVPAVGLGIKKQRGSNAVRVAEGVSRRIAEIQKSLPAGLSVRVNFDTTQFIKQTTGEMKFALILSAILTSVVCLLFLASWGSTFNVLLAIPTSIVGSFLFLYFCGFTLNTFTLLALILAIGIVVDDAIMVLENIVRHREMGKSPLQASLDGVKEIAPAAVAATLAIIAIFIPVIFMKGVIGKFFFQFGITLSVAVLLSLLEALTLTPMRCARFLAVKREEGAFSKKVNTLYGQISALYLKWLQICLRHRGRVVGGALALFVLSFALLPGLKKEFVPAQDQSAFLIRVQTPLGSSIDFTDVRMKQAEEMVSNRPEVLRYFSAVGGFGGGDVNTGMIFVTLKAPRERPYHKELKHRPSQMDMMNLLRQELSRIPDFKPVFMDLSTRGFTAERGFPVEFTVRGPDWQKLADTSDQLVRKMKNSPFFLDVDTDYQLGQPSFEITPKREAAAARGVSLEAMGQTIQAMMGGVRAGKFTESGHRNDIRVRLDREFRQDSEAIQHLWVRNDTGELVSLKEIVDIKDALTLKSITRKDRERAIGIFANVGLGKSQDKALAEVEKFAHELLPEDYRIVFSGSAETFRESFGGLLFALYLGIIVAYMVLGSQYNSFIHPFTVLLALPFSLSGAFVALRLTGNSLNLYSFIGLILLMGIVKKNSILLVDFTNKKRREGGGVKEALLAACPQRLRPILMTSFATIAAAIPPALAVGPGAETRIPMAVVIIGGVLASTFLTLFVVPCAYSLLSRFERGRH